MWGLGCGVSGVWGLGLGVWGLMLGVQGLSRLGSKCLGTPGILRVWLRSYGGKGLSGPGFSVKGFWASLEGLKGQG